MQAFHDFVRDNCVVHPTGLVSVVDLCGAYRSWRTQRGLPVLSRGQIVAEVRAAGLAIGQHGSRMHIVGVEFKQPPLVVVNGRVAKA
jgi:hypothetical protein